MRKRRFAVGTAIAVALAAACSLANPLAKYQAEKDLPDAPPAPTGSSDEAAAPPVDAGPSWHLYSLDWTTMTWASPRLLADVWTGPNAPPSRDIVTAVQLVDFPRLIIFAKDGNVYVRSGQDWQKPLRIDQAFGPLTSPPEAAYHVPYAFSHTVNATATFAEGLTLFSPPFACAFTYAPDDKITFDGQSTIVPEDGGPSADLGAVWSFELLDLGNPDPGAHWRNYTLYVDGKIYQYRADDKYSSELATESPMFQGKADAPPPASLTAAWFDEATKTAYFAGP